MTCFGKVPVPVFEPEETVNINQSEPTRLPDGTGISELASPVRAALAQLANARDYARDVHCDPWEFAIEIEHLIGLGVTISDLRWLVKKGLAEHACEVTLPGDPTRRFQRRENLAFTKESCFLLADSVSLSASALSTEGPDTTETTGSADATISTASTSCFEPPPPHPGSNLADSAPLAAAPQTPRWDADDRTLYFGNLIVKEYRVRSPNQEAVLSAFEEEGWPHYIDDPLSPVADQSPKQRLRDTIKCLNANQRNRMIRFRGDGTGERVRWEPANMQPNKPFVP